MKTWEEYRKQAITTAIYPKKYKIIYPALGLVDESVEFYEKIDSKGQLAECGDCFWYVALLTNDLKFDINSIYEDATEKDGFGYVDIYEAGIDLIRCSSKICGVVKKWLRDEKGALPSTDKQLDIEFELTEYMAALLYICDALQVHWSAIAQMNLDKNRG